jgi:hypothetical protein
MKGKVILYLCDQKKECAFNISCARNGGPCKHTTNLDNAINGEAKKADLKERFNSIELEDEIQYWEIEK